MEFVKSYPGSFGEVIQGNVHGTDMLLSCPINIYTKAKVFETKSIEGREKWSKAHNFTLNLLKIWGYEKYYNNVDIHIDSQIPYGKGMASSTADLCAVYYCLLDMFHREFNENELVNNCIKVEPTDSIIFNTATLFDYKKGLYKEKIGEYFNYDILVFEGKGIVDTVEFNNKKLPPLSNVEDLFLVLKQAFNEKDVNKLAYVANESIKRNQNRLSYDWINKVEEIMKSTSGSGIIGAHSGNVLGIIYDDKEKLDYTINFLKNIEFCKTYAVKTLDKHIIKLTL